jgi:NitT/TauT family transport system permease protein
MTAKPPEVDLTQDPPHDTRPDGSREHVQKTRPLSLLGGRAALTWIPRPGWSTLAVVAAALGLVQIASLFFPAFIFPDVPRIAQALWETLTSDSLNIWISLVRFSVALILAIGCGWLLGLLMGAFRSTFGTLLSPVLNILMAVPALSWILISVLWVSSIEARVIFICFIIGMPFFAVAVYEGIRDIDSDIVKAVEQFRPNRLQVIRTLFIPQSLVFLLTSIRSASSLCLRILVFAEMIGATTGIGQQMSMALANFRIDMIFAWSIVMIIGNFLLVALISRAERTLLKWRDEVELR